MIDKPFVFDPEKFFPADPTWERGKQLAARYQIRPPSTDAELTQIQAALTWGQMFNGVLGHLLGTVGMLPSIHDQLCKTSCQGEPYCRALVEFGLPQALIDLYDSLWVQAQIWMDTDGKDNGVLYAMGADTWQAGAAGPAIQAGLIASARAFLLKHGYYVIKAETPGH